MKIAVTSQNRKIITGHAGKCRKFWIYETDDQTIVNKTLLELAQAVTPELQHDLDALREALKRLDAAQLREALKQLAESGKAMREQLARSRELFQRAAIEGSMTTLAQDADELAQQQREWNKETQGAHPDSTLARAERDLAAEADSLRARLAALDSAVQRSGETPQGETPRSVASEQRQARQAAGC